MGILFFESTFLESIFLVLLFFMRLAFEYPITRPYPWRYTTPGIIALSVAALATLITINIPLVGYTSVLEFSPDFNATETHWFDKFMPPLQRNKGRFCDPYILTLGDSFQTTFGIFRWTITGLAEDARFLVPSLALQRYSNTELSSCDATSLSLYATPQITEFEVTVTMTCLSPFYMKASTTYTESLDPSRDSSLQFFNFQSALGETRNATQALGVIDVIDGLGIDMLQDIRAQPAGQVPWIDSFFTTPTCANTACTSEQDANPPTFLQTLSVEPKLESLHRTAALDGRLNTIAPPWQFAANNTVSNLFTALLLAARLDIGHITPNNIFTNIDAINGTIRPGHSLADLFRTNHTGTYRLAQFPVKGVPSTIRLSHTCHSLRRKPFAEFMAALFVAVATMFSFGFTVLSLLASSIAKRASSRGNICMTHHDDSGLLRSDEVEARVGLGDHGPSQSLLKFQSKSDL